MAARAVWKGVLHIGGENVPVKLFSALADRSVHFRLLHRRDRSPVQQVMINSTTGKPVPYEETQKAYQTANNQRVLLSREELEQLQPAKSRMIEVSEFLPRKEIDHRWFERPYYLAPDGSEQVYSALSQALSQSNLLGIARWTMRHARQVVPLSELDAPTGEPLGDRDLLMARQLINMLEAEFEPTEYADEYRQRVLEMIEEKRQGKKVKKFKARTNEPPSDINKALQASLQRARG